MKQGGSLIRAAAWRFGVVAAVILLLALLSQRKGAPSQAERPEDAPCVTFPVEITDMPEEVPEGSVIVPAPDPLPKIVSRRKIAILEGAGHGPDHACLAHPRR